MATDNKARDGMDKRESYAEKVAKRIIEQLEQGTAPWQKPWKPGELHMPYNPTTDKTYRGFNSVWLLSQGRDDPRWMTYKQASTLGAQVRPGEKGVVIQYAKSQGEEPLVDDTGKPILGDDGKQKTQLVQYERPKIFHAVVFNASQIDGLPPLEPKTTIPEWQRHEMAEATLNASGVVLRHVEADHAYYSPGKDEITLPERKQFNTVDGYYATALHELGHATGHVSRLDRDLSHPFGSEGYAKEELRAEIASLMLGERLEIGHDPGQHVAYVDSWIKVLQKEPREIFRAAADAEKIAGYVQGFTQDHVQEHAQQIGGRAMPDIETTNVRLQNEGILMKTNERTYLAVPFREKDMAKAAAKDAGFKLEWDKEVKAWAVPAGIDPAPLARWMPGAQLVGETKIDPVKEFGHVLADAGLLLKGDPIMDGIMRRVQVDGDKDSERSGAYIGHADGHPAGYIQNFRTGEKTNWKSSQKIDGLSEIDRTRLQLEAAERVAEREADRKALHEAVSDRLTVELKSEKFAPADPQHPYLVKKGLQGDAGALMQDQQGNLVIPAADHSDRVWTVQRIDGEGRKGFEKDGALAGHYNIGPSTGFGAATPIVIVEGWATGETIRRATGATVVTAFTAANLEAVAKTVRERNPDCAILIAGDNDHQREHELDPRTGKPKINQGKIAAQKAAEVVGGYAAIPEFDAKSKGSDWNDYAQEHGTDALKKAMNESMILADRRMLADSHRLGHDAERVAETVLVHQAEQEQSAGDAQSVAANADMKSAYASLRNAAEREGDRQDKSDELYNGQPVPAGADASAEADQEQQQQPQRNRGTGRSRGR